MTPADRKQLESFLKRTKKRSRKNPVIRPKFTNTEYNEIDEAVRKNNKLID